MSTGSGGGQPHLVDDRVEVDDAAGDGTQVQVVGLQGFGEVGLGEGRVIRLEQMVVDTVGGVQEADLQGAIGRPQGRGDGGGPPRRSRADPGGEDAEQDAGRESHRYGPPGRRTAREQVGQCLHRRNANSGSHISRSSHSVTESCRRCDRVVVAGH